MYQNPKNELNKKREIFKKIRKIKKSKEENSNGKLNITIFSGAGVSQESGIQTFRAEDGLWNNHSIMKVATPEGYKSDPEFVTGFYNDVRTKISESKPNDAHFIIAELEKLHNVKIVTQNIDDLHERAGSTDVLHLHGEINKLQSLANPKRVFDIPEGQTVVSHNQRDPKTNSPLRPHVVFFSEKVPNFIDATHTMMASDIVIVVGTSLNVQPASGLLNYIPKDTIIYVINPDLIILNREGINYLEESATKGFKKIKDILIDNYDKKAYN